MKYQVQIAPSAVEDAIEAWRFIALDSPEAADRWYEQLTDAIDSLSVHPRRFPKAREAAEMEIEIRQLNFKSHRVLFTITGKVVQVHHIPHAARRNL